VSIQVPWQLLAPTSGTAHSLVLFEWLLFALWFLAFVWQAWRIYQAKREFDAATAAIPGLEAAVMSRKDERGDPELVRPEFERALEQSGVSLPTVRDHLWALFSCGYRDADMDTGELIRKSDEQVCRWEASLRSTVGIFVIVGLLGTLLNIAATIQFLAHSPPAKDASGKSEIVQHFLAQLSGAFTPSLWGVLLSIVCAVLYSWLLFFRSGWRVRLRELTFREWAPRLRPPVTRRLQDLSQRTYESAHRVVEFATEIDENSAGWSQAVLESRESAEKIAAAMSAMNASVDAARKTSEDALTEMGTKLQGLNTALGEWQTIGQKIVEFEERQTETVGRIEVHIAALAKATSGLDTAVSTLNAPVQEAAEKIERIALTFSSDVKTLAADLLGPVEEAVSSIVATAGHFGALCEQLLTEFERAIWSGAALQQSGWKEVVASVEQAGGKLVTLTSHGWAHTDTALTDASTKAREERKVLEERLVLAAAGIEGLNRALSTRVSEILEGAATKLEGKNDSGWKAVLELVKAASEVMAVENRTATEKFIQDVAALKQAHGDEVGAVKTCLTRLQESANEMVRDVKALGPSFEESATKVANETTAGVQRLTTVTLGLKEAADRLAHKDLENAIRTLSASISRPPAVGIRPPEPGGSKGNPWQDPPAARWWHGVVSMKMPKWRWPSDKRSAVRRLPAPTPVPVVAPTANDPVEPTDAAEENKLAAGGEPTSSEAESPGPQGERQA